MVEGHGGPSHGGIEPVGGFAYEAVGSRVAGYKCKQSFVINSRNMKKLLTVAALLSCMGLAEMNAQETKPVDNRANFGQMMFVAPEPAIMIGTYDAQGVPDVMMAAWGSQCGRDEIMIHLSEHKTTENLRLKRAFTVSFATKETVAQSDYLGMVSAHEVPGKLTKVGFTVHKSPNVDAPIVDQYPVTIECQVVSFEKGVLIGKVVNTSADKSVLDDQGNIDFGKLHPVVFDPVSNTYREVGEVVGQAWKSGETYK